MSFLGTHAICRPSDGEGQNEDRGETAKAESGALEEALEHEHRHTLIRGPAGLNPITGNFPWAQLRVWPKMAVGIDLFVGHVKKAVNRARAPSPSLIRLN
ncbi:MULTISPECIES: hypothetical protein [unclassified Bradyrhizobium]|uniref:hypothetical protein n=1 Tax=unclassified Bradyrhizobium TaxID=2631580 RepID=UPI001FF732A7|nr:MULTISPECIES: hypothetical protein [unclassified Bradyrhizobium]